MCIGHSEELNGYVWDPTTSNTDPAPTESDLMTAADKFVIVEGLSSTDRCDLPDCVTTNDDGECTQC